MVATAGRMDRRGQQPLDGTGEAPAAPRLGRRRARCGERRSKRTSKDQFPPLPNRAPEYPLSTFDQISDSERALHCEVDDVARGLEVFIDGRA